MGNDKLKEVFESLKTAITLSPHDWSTHHRTAWVYGIICGWNDDGMEELAVKFSWSDEDIIKLKSYNQEINKLKIKNHL